MFFCPEFILRELGLNRACRTVVDLEGSLDAIEVISQAAGAWLFCTDQKQETAIWLIKEVENARRENHVW